MRKITSILLTAALAACFVMTGCKGKPDIEDPVVSASVASDPVEDYTQAETVPSLEGDIIPEDADFVDSDALKDPVFLWCDLYNPNGFNTVTGLFTNPNSVAVDITYDLVFYKDGVEVYRGAEYGAFNIAPNATGIIWENWDLPNPEDVDEIKMENIYVFEAYYPSVSGSFEKDREDDSDVYYKFSFEKEPTLANIWFLFYNDKNGNGQPDGGETVVTSYSSIIGDQTEVSYEKGGFDYTDVAVYYDAY